jgi:mannitol-1-phosphate/altronate dehydrogenase
MENYKNFLKSLSKEEKKKLIEEVKNENEERFYREALEVFRQPSSPDPRVGKTNSAGIPLFLIK